MVAVITPYLLITLEGHLSASLKLFFFSAFRAAYIKNLVVKAPAFHILNRRAVDGAEEHEGEVHVGV